MMHSNIRCVPLQWYFSIYNCVNSNTKLKMAALENHSPLTKLVISKNEPCRYSVAPKVTL
ncbi:Uncharacterised protein [Yersinia intermedia]|nr:Uncharacterised protein [Yersinia intermedia]CNH37986.1 Uncharacterised protein [Yersinia intermedia]